MKSVKNDTLMTLNDQGVQKIQNIHFFKMATGGHFGFWPLSGFPPHFGEGHGCLFCLKYSKVHDPIKKLLFRNDGHGMSIYDPTISTIQ